MIILWNTPIQSYSVRYYEATSNDVINSLTYLGYYKVHEKSVIKILLQYKQSERSSCQEL